MFAPSIQSLERELYTWHILSIGGSDQCLLDVVRYKANRQSCSAQLPREFSVSHVMESIRSDRTLKRSVSQTMADCNSARNLRSRDELFQSLEFDHLASRKSLNSEERLVMREVQIEAAR